MTNETLNNAAYLDGVRCRGEELPRSANPYPYGCPSFEAWDQGWKAQNEINGHTE